MFLVNSEQPRNTVSIPKEYLDRQMLYTSIQAPDAVNHKVELDMTMRNVMDGNLPTDQKLLKYEQQ